MSTQRRSQSSATAGPSAGQTHLLGALIVASTASAVFPAILGGNAFATRAALVLLVGVGWLIAFAGGQLRYQREQVPWMLGLASIVASLLISVAVNSFPVSNLMDGMGTSMGVVYWTALMLVALGAAGCNLDTRIRRWISLAFLLALSSAIVALLQAAAHVPVTAGLSNDNHFGLFMLLWAPVSAGLALTAAHRIERWSWICAGVVIAASTVVAQANTAIVALACEVGLLSLIASPLVADSRTRRVTKFAGGALAGLVIALMAVVALAGSLGPQGLAWLPQWVQSALATRAYLWQNAVAVFREAPLLGHGPDGYVYAAQTHTPSALMALEHGSTALDTIAADPHSLPLRVLVNLGVLGASALVAAAVGWSLAVARIRMVSTEAGILRTSFAIGAAGFLIGSLFAPWGIIVGAAPAVVIGLAASGSKKPRGLLATPPTLARIVLAVPLVGVLAYAGYSHGTEARAYQLSTVAQTSQEQQRALHAAVAAAPWDAAMRFLELQAIGKAAATNGEGAAFRRRVDADALVRGFAPYVAELVRLSLIEAQLTGRTDVSWEMRQLDSALSLGPEIPEVSAERLHLAVLTKDPGRIRDSLTLATGVAELAANYEYYRVLAIAALNPR